LIKAPSDIKRIWNWQRCRSQTAQFSHYYRDLYPVILC